MIIHANVKFYYSVCFFTIYLLVWSIEIINKLMMNINIKILLTRAINLNTENKGNDIIL